MFGSENAEIIDQFSYIHVPPIQNREGQILRNEIKKALYAQGKQSPEKYVLLVKATSTDADLTYLSDQTAGRKVTTVSIRYQLMDKASNKAITSGSLSRSAEYNVETANSFGTVISSEKVKADAIHLVARDLILALTKYFIEQQQKPNEEGL